MSDRSSSAVSREGTGSGDAPGSGVDRRNFTASGSDDNGSLAWPDSHHDRLVCICVDGFGSDVGTNRAALRLTAMERVHAIGCSVSGEAWKTWSRLLRRLDADGVDIGLRLNLTDAAFLARSDRKSVV